MNILTALLVSEIFEPILGPPPTPEEKAREEVPAVKEAWERYQLLLKLALQKLL